jgi:hypothetical protein
MPAGDLVKYRRFVPAEADLLAEFLTTQDCPAMRPARPTPLRSATRWQPGSMTMTRSGRSGSSPTPRQAWSGYWTWLTTRPCSTCASARPTGAQDWVLTLCAGSRLTCSPSCQASAALREPLARTTGPCGGRSENADTSRNPITARRGLPRRNDPRRRRLCHPPLRLASGYGHAARLE